MHGGIIQSWQHHFLLFPFGTLHTLKEKILKMGVLLGTSLSQISAYFPGLCLTFPNCTDHLWLWPSFICPQLYCAVLLDGIGAHISHTRPLQKADIAMASWIFGIHGNTCPVFLLQVLQKVPSSLYLLATPPPLAFGLKQSGVVPKSWCHLPGSAMMTSLVTKTHPVRVCGRTERLGGCFAWLKMQEGPEVCCL